MDGHSKIRCLHVEHFQGPKMLKATFCRQDSCRSESASCDLCITFLLCIVDGNMSKVYVAWAKRH